MTEPKAAIPMFTPAEELRFLAAQCDAQVRSTHRDQDRTFIHQLAARLHEVGGCALLDFIARMIADACKATGELRPDGGLIGVIESRAQILRELADMIDGITTKPDGRAA